MEAVDVCADGILDADFVDQGAAQHLVAAADADDDTARGSMALDCIGESALLEVVEVGDSGFGAGDDDAVGLAKLTRIVDVAETDAGLARERVEVVEIGDAGAGE